MLLKKTAHEYQSILVFSYFFYIEENKSSMFYCLHKNTVVCTVKKLIF